MIYLVVFAVAFIGILVGAILGVWIIESQTHIYHFDDPEREIVITVTGSGSQVSMVTTWKKRGME